MLLCFWIVVLCTFIFVLYNIYKVYCGKTYKVFFDKSSTTFNFVESLVLIIKKKISNLPAVEYECDYSVFCSMGLKQIPVYVVDKNKIGNSHLKLYKSALEQLDTPINFVVLNGAITVLNPKINTILLDKSKISVQQFALLNILNVNRLILQKPQQLSPMQNTFARNSSIADYGNVENLSCQFVSPSFFACIKKGEKYKLDLPHSYYNYMTKGKRNKLVVQNIFGQKLLETVGSFSCELIKDQLFFTATKNDTINLYPRYSSYGEEILKLLNFTLSTEKYGKEIDSLWANAQKQFLSNIFACEKKVKGVNVANLKTFFKVSDLRKNYFNDYVFLLKELFGIRVAGGVLVVNPCELIDFDFDINYSLDGTDYVVKYSHISGEKVKLNYVGHKLGHQDDYVFGF